MGRSVCNYDCMSACYGDCEPCGPRPGDDAYPTWVCFECGEKYGRHAPGICTVHEDVCGICGKTVPVTEPRDFGHLRDEWRA